MTVTDTKPVAPAGGRHFIKQGPSRRWMIGFCSLLALSVIGALVLTYVGIKTVRSSRAGQVVSAITDPAAPGFEAFLEPSPTLAIVQSDGGTLGSIAVVALNPGDVGGSVLLVSPELRGGSGSTSKTLSAIASSARDPVKPLGALQAKLGFGITETAVMDDARWAEVVAPVSPLQVENPSTVGSFAEGPLTLTADQVGPYLRAVNPDERPHAAVLRQRAFYRAWLDAVAASGDAAAVPGETASGLGRFIRGAASGPHQVEAAPVVEKVVDGSYDAQIDATAMAELVPQLVPFPVAGVPGGRVRVRLVDGTGDQDHVQRVAPLVIPGNAEIVVVGNASTFDYHETEIRYHNELAKPAATKLQATLGTGRLVDDPVQNDAFDVTIVLGTDI